MEATMKQPKQRKKRQILSPQARTDLTGYSFLLPNLIGCALFTFIRFCFPCSSALRIGITPKASEAGILSVFRILSICGATNGLSTL